MSWKDRLLPGSFRGVSFFIESHTKSGGRRNVQHQFPDRDDPYTEDLGRKAQSFSIEIHLIGDDVFEQATAMESVLNQEGSGELIHPYLGSLNVNVDGYSRSEDTKEGRIVRFSISFLESGINKFPSEDEDRAQTLFDKANGAIDSAKEKFSGVFNVLNQPGFVVNDASSIVNNTAGVILNATSVITDATDSATDLAFSVRGLQRDATALVQLPGLLADRLFDALALLSRVAGSAETASDSYKLFFDYEGAETPLPEIDTTPRVQQRLNRQAFDDYIQEVSIILATEEAVDRQFFTIDEALEEQENLKSFIDRQAQKSDNINFFQSMQDLGGALVSAVPDPDTVLPNLVEIQVKDTTNTLVLAYDLFEDPDQEQQIIDRNKIRNPNFVIGGTVLEVVNESA